MVLTFPLEDFICSPEEADDHWEEITCELKDNGINLISNPEVPPVKILDLGAGAGILARELNKKEKIFCVSLELKRRQRNEGALQVQAEAQNLPFPDAAFDIVHAKAVFDPMYSNNAPQIFMELHRVLRENGILIIEDADMPDKVLLEPYFELINDSGKPIRLLSRKQLPDACKNLI